MTKREIPKKIRIYAFRHGQTDWNKEGRIQGHLDIPLNAQGKEEALRLAYGFRRVRLGLITSSDLSRAMDTATLALSEAKKQSWHPDIRILADERLREVNLGALQGLTHDEIHARFGKELSGKLGKKILSDEELRDLGSEPAERLIGRVVDAISDAIQDEAFLLSLREARSDETIALGVSTHGGVLRRLLHAAGRIEEIRFSIPNGVFFPFDFEPENRTLVLTNESPFV